MADVRLLAASQLAVQTLYAFFFAQIVGHTTCKGLPQFCAQNSKCMLVAKTALRFWADTLCSAVAAQIVCRGVLQSPLSSRNTKYGAGCFVM
eukprot:6200612-Pleurochrysis_carterae.AAC.2